MWLTAWAYVHVEMGRQFVLVTCALQLLSLAGAAPTVSSIRPTQWAFPANSDHHFIRRIMFFSRPHRFILNRPQAHPRNFSCYLQCTGYINPMTNPAFTSLTLLVEFSNCLSYSFGSSCSHQNKSFLLKKEAFQPFLVPILFVRAFLELF